MIPRSTRRSMRRSNDWSGTSATPPKWTALVCNRSLWLLTISYGCIGYVEYLLSYWPEHYFNDVLHFTKDRSRLASMILTIPTSRNVRGVREWPAPRLRRSAGRKLSRLCADRIPCLIHSRQESHFPLR